jgi:hypothetical protein
MTKTANRPNLIVLLLVLVVVAVGAYAWLHKRPLPGPVKQPASQNPPAAQAPHAVAADRIDPSNEGRVIAISGKLDVRTPSRDTQLGVSADAVMLLRYAEMLQWREQCSGANCTYQQVWSPQLIDSRKFRVQEGHKNPERLPLTTARFSAGDLRLGAFRVDAAVLGNYRLDAALHIKPVPYPVHASQLPSNLAISFRDANGVLYAGDPEHRAVGDVRVSYRIIPAESVEITGVQRGDRLIVRTSKANPA